MNKMMDQTSDRHDESNNSDDHLSFEKLEKELKEEIHAKLALPGQTGRTRAQRMVHIPIITNLSSDLTSELEEHKN